MSFAEFPQQRGVVGLLQRSLERGRLAHAYLFGGMVLEELEGVASALAATLVCERPLKSPNGTPLDSCGACVSCRKVRERLHPDVQWVRPESKLRLITIDQIRELLQTVHLKPTQAEYKVAVLSGVDRLKQEAANSFLKTLEEPPAKCVFILLTTEPSRVLETIVSRCQRLAFGGAGDLQVEEDDQLWMQQFAGEAVTVKSGTLGRYRLLALLTTRLGEIKEQIEKELTARSPLERFDEVDPKLRERWEVELTAGIEAEYRRRRSNLLVLVEWWLRDVWLRTLDQSGEGDALPSLAESSRALASRLQPHDALENLGIIEKTHGILFTNAQESLALEVGLLKLRLG